MPKHAVNLSTDSLNKLVSKAAALKVSLDSKLIKSISNEETLEELQDQISEFPSDLLADSLILAAIQIIQLNTKIEEIKSVIKKH